MNEEEIMDTWVALKDMSPKSRAVAEKIGNMMVDMLWRDIDKVYRDKLKEVRATIPLTSNEYDRNLLMKFEFSLQDFLDNGKERVVSLLKGGMSGEAAAKLIAERIKNGEKI